MLCRGWGVGWCPRVLLADDRALTAVASAPASLCSFPSVGHFTHSSCVLVMLHACEDTISGTRGRYRGSREPVLLNLKALLSV